MRYLGYLLGALGCALGMVVCMAMMARRNHRQETDPGPAQAGEGSVVAPQTPEVQGERSAASDV